MLLRFRVSLLALFAGRLFLFLSLASIARPLLLPGYQRAVQGSVKAFRAFRTQRSTGAGRIFAGLTHVLSIMEGAGYGRIDKFLLGLAASTPLYAVTLRILALLTSEAARSTSRAFGVVRVAVEHVLDDHRSVVTKPLVFLTLLTPIDRVQFLVLARLAPSTEPHHGLGTLVRISEMIGSPFVATVAACQELQTGTSFHDLSAADST